MIIIQYLVRETLKSQVVILFILILIFFSKKTITILNSVVQGNIPSNLLFPLLWFGIPEMGQLILPLSLFIGLLMTYSKLYINSEIIIMHACGLGKKILIIVALILALFTSLIAAINIIWILPWSARHQEQVLANAKANPSLINITEGQFKISKNQNIVLYIKNIKGKDFTDIFMTQLQPTVNNRHHFVVIAENGHFKEYRNGKQVIILDKGTCYEGTVLLGDFRITEFKDYQAVIDHKKTVITGNKVEQMDMLQLWYSTDVKAKIEFHWRLTLLFAVVIMALIVVPLSEVNPRYGRLLTIFPAVLLYLIFFLLQSTLHSSAAKWEINSNIIMWLINMAFLLLAFILNIWDTVCMRRLRIKFYKGFFNV